MWDRGRGLGLICVSSLHYFFPIGEFLFMKFVHNVCPPRNVAVFQIKFFLWYYTEHFHHFLTFANRRQRRVVIRVTSCLNSDAWWFKIHFFLFKPQILEWFWSASNRRRTEHAEWCQHSLRRVWRLYPEYIRQRQNVRFAKSVTWKEHGVRMQAWEQSVSRL